MDITDTNKKSIDLELYENASLLDVKTISESNTQRFKEEGYETIRFKDAREAKIETDRKSNTLSGLKLKVLIYSSLVSICVLYVALIALIIFLFVLTDPAIMSAFSVTQPHTYSNTDGVGKLNFSSTIYQYGSDFDISTGTFTCRLPGVYHFSATLVKKKTSTGVDHLSCYITKNSQSLINIKIDPTDVGVDKGSATVSQSIVIELDIGDTVYLSRCNCNCNDEPNDFMEPWSSFTGFLLYHSK